MQKQKGPLITFEGIDGSGKTRNVRNLENFLSHSDTPHFVCNEYEDNTESRTLRNLVISKDWKFSPASEAMLFFCARLEHTKSIIRPYLERGYTVIADRYTHSTMAYQGLRYPQIDDMYDVLSPFFEHPDLIIFLDVPPEVSASRVLDRGDGVDGIESRGIEYFAQVRQRFFEVMQDENVVIVDATAPLEEVFVKVVEHVTNFLEAYHAPKV